MQHGSTAKVFETEATWTGIGRDRPQQGRQDMCPRAKVRHTQRHLRQVHPKL